MSYRFQMRFAGLCAFVPEKDLGDRVNRVDVLVVNPDGGPEGLLSRKLRRHTPMMRFDLTNLPGMNGSAGNLKLAKGTLELDSMDLTLHLRPQGAKDDSHDVPLRRGVQIAVKTRRDSAKPLQDTEEVKDFTWIACIEDVLPGAEVNRDLLRDFSKEVVPENILAARIRLHEGTLRTDRVADYRGDFVVFQFVPSSAVRQALGYWAALDVDVPDGLDIVIRLQPFGRSEVEELVLRPNGEQEVLVDISNLCCGNYIELQEDDGEVPDADVDFEAYYLLCKDPRALKERCGKFPIPIPIEYNSRPNEGLLSTSEGGGTGVDCKMAFFSSLYRESKGEVPLARQPIPTMHPEPLRSQVSLGMPHSSPEMVLPRAFQRTESLDVVRATTSQAGTRLNVPIQKQFRSQICWAAVAASIDDHYRNDPVNQCVLVEDHLGISGCCPECERSDCNGPRPTAEALERLGRLQKQQEGAPEFRTIQHEISQNRPIVAGIGLNSSDHVVVIDGWDLVENKEHLWITDPKNRSLRRWRYEEFKDNPGFRWQRTYFTK